MSIFIKKLTVISNNSKMSFDYYINRNIDISTSIYIGKNGEGKSFSMRLLSELMSALKKFSVNNTTIPESDLYYNQYKLTVTDEYGDIVIDTQKINHPRNNNTDSNNPTEITLNQIKIYYQKSNRSKKYTKLELFSMLPKVIVPDYNNVGKINTDPWHKEKSNTVQIYQQALENILHKDKYKEIINSQLYEYCHLTLEYSSNNANIEYHKNNGERSAYEWLSSGENSIIFTWAYIINEVANTNTATHSAILMIDEPESSLHPEWQRYYLYYLKEILKKLHISGQIIIATHSPFIISALNPKDAKIYNIHNITEDNKLEKISKEQPSSYGSSIDRTLTTTMELSDTRSLDFCNDFNYLVEQLRLKTPIESLQTNITNLQGFLSEDDELWIFLDMLEKRRFDWK